MRSTIRARPAGVSISAEPAIVALTTGQTANPSVRDSFVTRALGRPPRIAASVGDNVYQLGASTSTREPTSSRRRRPPGTFDQKANSLGARPEPAAAVWGALLRLIAASPSCSVTSRGAAPW